MSYIPDARHKMKINIYTGKQTDELNGYWYKILEGDDKTELFGFDWAMDRIENTLLCYLENEGIEDEEKIKRITEIVLDCLEDARDELVVSMIDSMEQADYDRRFEEVKDLPEDEKDKWEE